MKVSLAARLRARFRRHFGSGLFARLVHKLASLNGVPGRLGEALYLHTLYVPIAGADAVEGARGTGNVGTNLLETDFASKVLELEPNSSPLLVLSKNMDKEACINPKYTWFEDAPDARFDAINNGAGYTSGNTALVVDNGGYWHADDLAYVTRTGETLRVVSIATNTLTVIRGVGSTAAALVDNDELILVGSAAQEGALDKAAHSGNPSEIFNYTQIFRRPVEETGTVASTRNRVSPDDWNRQLNKKGIEHAKDMEYAAMLGHPSIDTTGTHPRRTTGGFVHYATQNSTDVGGAMTEAEFFDALRTPFRYTPGGTKLALAAAKPVDIVSAYPRSKLHIEQSERTFGIKVVQIISPHGTLNFVTHWLMEGTLLSQQIWLVDVASIGYRFLHGKNGSRDTKLRENINVPGLDGHKDEFLTECGFVIAQPLKHGSIVNITS